MTLRSVGLERKRKGVADGGEQGMGGCLGLLKGGVTGSSVRHVKIRALSGGVALGWITLDIIRLWFEEREVGWAVRCVGRFLAGRD